MKTSPLYLLRLALVLGSASMASAQAVDPAAIAPAASVPTAPSSPPPVEKGYLNLSFDYLASFTFVPPVVDANTNEKSAAKQAADQIPASVRSWNGKKAMIVGFMIPVKMEKGLVTEFLLMRNTAACCFGATPSLNEWVVVKMKKGGVRATMDVPVEFFGELKVNPMFENGYLTGIYELEGERMGEVKG